jgi:hypothetical protein
MSVVKCSWVKCAAKCCSVVMFSWFFLSFYRCVYGCVFCIHLFAPVSYVFFLSCLCIIVMYALLCYCYVCSAVYILFSFRLP